MTATIRGRIWRAPIPAGMGLHAVDRERMLVNGRWAYEVRDTGRLLVRALAPTHADAVARTCRHIRLAHETNQDTP